MSVLKTISDTVYKTKKYLLDLTERHKIYIRDKNSLYLCENCERPFREYQMWDYLYTKTVEEKSLKLLKEFFCPHCDAIGEPEYLKFSDNHATKTTPRTGVIVLVELGDDRDWPLYAVSLDCPKLSRKDYRKKIKERKEDIKRFEMKKFNDLVISDINKKPSVSEIRKQLEHKRMFE